MTKGRGKGGAGAVEAIGEEEEGAGLLEEDADIEDSTGVTVALLPASRRVPAYTLSRKASTSESVRENGASSIMSR